MAALARAKISDQRTLRLLALEGHRFTPQEALSHGIIDAIADGGSSDAVLNAAKKLASEKAQYAKTGVWSLIKVCSDISQFRSGNYIVSLISLIFLSFTERITQAYP